MHVHAGRCLTVEMDTMQGNTLATFADISEIATQFASLTLSQEQAGREWEALGDVARSIVHAGLPRAKELLAAVRSSLACTVPSRGLRLLEASGALTVIIPPIADIITLSQEPGRRHKDVWEHTLAVVDGTPPIPAVRLAALLHDVGKAATLRYVRGKGATFHGHPMVGAKLASAVLADASEPDEHVVWLVEHHLRPAEHSAQWTDSAVRRFVRDCGPRAGDLLALSRADLTTRNPIKRKRAVDNADTLVSRMETVIAEDAVPQALRKGFGTWLRDRWGVEPGPTMGAVKRELERRIDEGELPRNEEHITYDTAVGEALAKLGRGGEPTICTC